MVKIRIKSWEELEKITKRQDAAGNMVIDGDAFVTSMSYLCNTTYMVDLSKGETYIDNWRITPDMYEVVEPSLIEAICEEIGVEVGEERYNSWCYEYIRVLSCCI